MSNQEPTPNASPVKLGQHHKLFMTKLQVSPTKNSNSNNNNNNNPSSRSGSSSPVRIKNDINSDSNSNNVSELGSPMGNGSGNTAATSINTMNANSSRVIDSLHDQVDTLTETNLELTKQSHSLLNKLETVQINETKLMEDLSHLKNANELVNNELSDSTTRLKQLEEQLTELKLQYNDEIKLKLALERQIKTVKVHEDESLKYEVLMRQSQYDTLLSNQQNYKEMYTKKINDMTERLEALKNICNTDIEDNNDNENDDDNDEGIYGEKLKNMEILSKEYDEMDKNFIEYIQDDKLQSMINDNFKLEDWIQLNKDMNETFNTYVSKMDIPDAVIDKLKHELHISSKTNGKPMIRMRNTSGSINNNNNDMKDKRRSYYGSLRNGSQEHIANDATLVNGSNESVVSETGSRIPSDGSMSLPGVKRTSSVRRNPSVSRPNKKL